MNRMTIKDCLLLNIPKVHDERGSLGVIEKSIIPFKMPVISPTIINIGK